MNNKLNRIIKESDILYYMLDGQHKECDYEDEVRQLLLESKLVLYKSFIFDIDRLASKVNFDCFNCHKINANGCCNGAPSLFTGKVYGNLSENLYQIIKDNFSDNEISDMLKCGIMAPQFDNYENEIGGQPLTYVDDNGNYQCPFLMTGSNGAKLCSIKHWCYENDKRITDYCHFECLLFPLELFLLRFDGKEYKLLTSLIDRSFEPYCRWGVDDSTHYACFETCDRKQIPDGIFKRRDYIPVFKAFKELIVAWFGIGVYNKLRGLI